MTSTGGPAGDDGGLPGGGTSGGGPEPAGTGAATHEVALAPGMSRPELVRSLEAEVPAKARFVEADGDVDCTLRWQTSDLDPVDRLVAAEATAWREWRDAEDRRHDFARLQRHAADAARLAQATWHGVATELARRHPTYSEFTGTEPRPAPDPGPSHTEAAAEKMTRRLHARTESMNGPAGRDPHAEPDPDEPNFQIIMGPDDTDDTEAPPGGA